MTLKQKIKDLIFNIILKQYTEETEVYDVDNLPDEIIEELK